MGPMDNDVIKDGCLHATQDGFALDIRSHWYRSLPGTSLAVLDLTVDGQKVADEDMTVVLNGKRFSIPDLEDAYDEWWYVLDAFQLEVRRPGFDAAVPHQVEFGLGLSIPYILVGPPDAKKPLLAASHNSRTLVCQ